MVRNTMVDNNTYNMLQAYVSTLEALEAFQKYSQDGNEQLWQEVAQHTEQVARLLQQQLPQALQQIQGGQGSMDGQSGMNSMSSQGGMGKSGNQSGMSDDFGATQRQSAR